MKSFKNAVLGVCVLSCLITVGASSSLAADLKIGVVNMQKVLSYSKAGQKAQSIIEQKMKSYDSSFKPDRDQLLAMREEIEKKSSAWSDATKQKKFGDFQKKSAELSTKERAANQDMKKLQETYVTPVLKKLEEVIDQAAQDDNYDLILPTNTVVFAGKSLDITDDITQKLDKAMK